MPLLLLAILLHSSQVRTPMLLSSTRHRNLLKRLNRNLFLPRTLPISNPLKPPNRSLKPILIRLFSDPPKPPNQSRNSSKIQPAWKIPKPPNRKHKHSRNFYSQNPRISNPPKPPNRKHNLYSNPSSFQIHLVSTIPKPLNPSSNPSPNPNLNSSSNPNFSFQHQSRSKRSRPIPRELPKKARRLALFSPISARYRSNALHHRHVRLFHSALFHPDSKQKKQTRHKNDPRAMVILPQRILLS